MTFSTQHLAITLGFVLALDAAACSSSSSTTDAGTSDAGSQPDSDAGSSPDATDANDASSTTDANTSGDSGDSGGGFLTATSCVGLTPITTVHMNVAGGFSPANISVSVGDTVKWVNDDASITHTVTSSAFAPTLNPGETICLTFTFTGKFPYACSIHPSMTGSVEVL